MAELYTLVQHSAYGYKGDPQFEKGVETRPLNTASVIGTVVKAGGVALSYEDASDLAHQEMYHKDNPSLMPDARGKYLRHQIDGLHVYIPVNKKPTEKED